MIHVLRIMQVLNPQFSAPALFLSQFVSVAPPHVSSRPFARSRGDLAFIIPGWRHAMIVSMVREIRSSTL